ncbi:hypothetical protein [Dactylosporangium sp. CA-233914]|uniref:hypothetical protein n=1 Tax=Dactylosporangium sp. CA-233914 TaxID=3239934 RepID=UPI003D8A7CD0
MNRLVPAALLLVALAGCGGDAEPPEPGPSPVPLAQQSLPGTDRRECVTVPGDARNVRSGQFIAGDFVEYRRQWTPGLAPGIGKIYWLPARPQPNTPLTITATSGGGRVEHYTGGSLSYNDGGQAMYPSGVPLPAAGTWKLVAQAGDDWGCFELTVPG